ncbi:MAG: hypothetical protein KDC92_13890 [Bacteroidetes bacterium]|nr:hypothetical protein [Bacteroidota bacterium]
MSLTDKFHKFSVYVYPRQAYWRKIENSKWKVDSKLGAFLGMHLKDRLIENHYDKFDESGIPLRIVAGSKVYNYTTICSYALANWEMYLESGEHDFTKPLWATLNYLKKNNIPTDYGGIVFPGLGSLSAMNQGEALSVIARCYELSKDRELIEFAKKVIEAFKVPVALNGVLGKFNTSQSIYWYEEMAIMPGKHILNGMCYALVGLYEIDKVAPEITEANRLFKDGVQYLKQALPMFDQGNWSVYWVDDKPPHYIASMMYHNLHIVQLDYLFSITGEQILKEYSDLFTKYQQSLLNRLSAGIKLIAGKLKS